jgi:quinol monooxygenase YgiN
MPLFVVSRLPVDPARLSGVLALIRAEFERAQRRPGRLQARVFQRVGSPGDLLGVVEWDRQESYDAFRRSPTYRAILDGLAAPAHTRFCARLHLFERPLHHTEVSACAIIAPGVASPTVVEQIVLKQGRTEVIPSPGLICHEVYRTLKRPPEYIVVHRWQRLADLERFRQHTSPGLQRSLDELGATLERFTGHLVAEYPVANA